MFPRGIFAPDSPFGTAMKKKKKEFVTLLEEASINHLIELI